MTKAKSEYERWVEFMARHLDKLKVVGQTDAEGCDAVICRLVTDPLMMPDNLVGQCSQCHRMIQFRPHAPKRPKKLCDECARPLIEKEAKKGDFRGVVTPHTAKDIEDFMRRLRMH